ncbi:MAG: hypothetical protein EXR44_00725 [Dehalococcoidia bacterium]|nr:hypothetical protein [Dehalococcoidia bacterium]
MPLKAILFDLDETLTMHERPFEGAHLEICLTPAIRHGLEASRIVVAQHEASRRICDRMKSRPFLQRIGIGARDILWGDPAATAQTSACSPRKSQTSAVLSGRRHSPLSRSSMKLWRFTWRQPSPYSCASASRLIRTQRPSWNLWRPGATRPV